MDLLLEQPLDAAAAFRAYFLSDVAAAAGGGAGAAAWTCFAAVLAAAAAAGLWRLRSSAPHAVKPLDLEHRSATTPGEPETGRTKETSASPESTSSSSPATAPLTPRERYTAYYRYDGGCVGCCDVEGDDEDEEDHHRQEDLEDNDGDVYGTPQSETDPFDWQQVVMPLPLKATAETELGRRRSPRALGGKSVVRLWDQGAEVGLTAVASPRRRRGVILAVSPF